MSGAGGGALWRTRGALVAHAVLAVLVVGALQGALAAQGYARMGGLGAAPVVSVVGVLGALHLLVAHHAAVAASRAGGRRGRRGVTALGARPLAAGAAGLGAGVGCWLVWLALPDALGWTWTTGALALPGPGPALVGACLSALVAAVAAAGVSGSVLAPLGAGVGLWLAHTVWLAAQGQALWAFAAALALPVGGAVAAAAVVLAVVGDLVEHGPSDDAVPLSRYRVRPSRQVHRVRQVRREQR